MDQISADRLLLRYSFLIGCGARTQEEYKEMLKIKDYLLELGIDPGWEDLGKNLPD